MHATKLKTDVLIIGGGFAGLWAARQAARHVKDVLIVDKGPRDWGGLGGMSGGDMITLHADQDINEWMDEIVFFNDGLCDQLMMLDTLRDSLPRFHDYEAMGHTFTRDEKGDYVRIPQRGLTHVSLTTSAPTGKGGINMRAALLRSMEGCSVRRMGNIMITAITKDGNRVSGAVGFFNRSGEPVFIEAKAVLITAGTGGWKASYLQNSMASGCVELALDAGARLRNFEFIDNWNVPKLFAWEGQTVLLPLGGRFINNQNEEFMAKRYSPVLGSKTDTQYNIRGMVLEVRAGRGPIVFDTSRIPEECMKEVTPAAGWMKLNNDKLKELGVDFFKDKIEWMPQPIASEGGIATDLEGATGVEGLFAAGTAQSLPTGVYFGGLSICHCATSGYKTGEAIGRYAADCNAPSFDQDQAEELLNRELSHLGRAGIAPKDIVRVTQELMAPVDVCVLKTDRGLRRSLARLEEVKHEFLPALGAEDPHYLCKMVEARGMLKLTEAYLRSSLERTESRAGHFRADHPCRDEATPLYWVEICQNGQNMVIERKELPMSDYPVKPYRYYMDQFTFPLDEIESFLR